MKIIVTGGAGFIGSHLVDALCALGHEVCVIDNLSTGKQENVNKKALFVAADISDFLAIERTVQEFKPDCIYHLAAQIDVRKSVENPIFDAQTNILATLNLIQIAHTVKVKKIVFASTGGAIYGDTTQRPTPEGHPQHPLSPYGIGKLAVDNYLHYFHTVQGLPYVSLRYGNVYGPRQNPHGEAGVVAIFMNKMLQNEQPIINGDGKQTRDYVYVEDVVAANCAVLKNMDTHGVFNIGTGIETSVNTLFLEINKHFGGTFEEKHGEAKPGEQQSSCLDTAKAQQELGWKSHVSFTEGIARTYKWFSEV